jgi:arabinofuranan 3-O-arabinosyltransferase
VRLDGREQLVRASADGRLAVRGSGVRTIAVTLLPLPGRNRLAGAALEVEELTLAGHDLPRPAARVTRPCGAGPALQVDGSTVATRVDGPRSALWGQGDLVWAACAPARLASGPTHDVVVRGDEALRPASVRLQSRAPAAQVAGDGALTTVPLRTDSPTHLTGPVVAGPQRLLALAMNSNAGWEATLDGSALTPVVVDGFRQGFVLPAGASGTVDVAFTPDRPYRLALGAGLALALLLFLAAVVPDRSRRVDPPAGDPGTAPRLVLVASGTLVFALVVAGPWAALIAGLVLVALVLRRSDADLPVALAVVGLVGAAGALVAVTSTAGRTQPWVEATVTLAVIAAGVLAGAAPVVPPSAWQDLRRRRGSATPGTG